MSSKKRIHAYIQKCVCTIIAMAIIAATAVALAAQPIWLELNQAYLYQAGSSPINRVAVANPAIADVVVLDKTKLNIVAKALGSTSLSVWSVNGMRQDFTISVCNTDTATAQFIKQSMGLSGVQVAKVGEKLVLQGVVENQYEKSKALGIAKVYAGEENIVDLLQMKNPTMVNLAAMVIDVTDDDESKLGFKYANASDVSVDDHNIASITFGTIGEFYGGMDHYELTKHPFQRVDFMIQALATKNKVRILSRPNITTMSGEEAEILIGGEMGIPTSKDGEIVVTWKEYGIHLKIKPTVDHENKITTSVQAEVSNLNDAAAVATTAGKIPGLSSRKAATVLTVPDGGTMSIGGLLDNRENKIVTKVPILGDIPIIGEFFKHTSNSKDRHELMILITPTIVTVNDPVKASKKLADAVEESKRQIAEMEDVFPNDPPKKQPLAKTDPEKIEHPVKEPVPHVKRDFGIYDSWVAKAEAELKAEAEAKEAAKREAMQAEKQAKAETAQRPVLPEAD